MALERSSTVPTHRQSKGQFSIAIHLDIGRQRTNSLTTFRCFQVQFLSSSRFFFSQTTISCQLRKIKLNGITTFHARHAMANHSFYNEIILYTERKIGNEQQWKKKIGKVSFWCLFRLKPSMVSIFRAVTGKTSSSFVCEWYSTLVWITLWHGLSPERIKLRRITEVRRRKTMHNNNNHFCRMILPFQSCSRRRITQKQQ